METAYSVTDLPKAFYGDEETRLGPGGDSGDRFTLLLIDDEPGLVSLQKRILRNRDYRFLSASTGRQALSILESHRVDLALVDYLMPGMDGLDLLAAIRKTHSQVKVIMVTGHGSVRLAVRALQAGAVDFIEKPFSPPTMRTRVEHHYRLWALDQENQRLRNRALGLTRLEDMAGNSEPMRRLKSLLALAASSEASVLITGETGTGKEITARCVHSLSPRAGGPFVAVDCASLGESLMENELFGHEKGSFTGAHDESRGLVRSADKGTLFLDEIGEMPLSLQSRFLRFIQSREVRPVGSSKTHPVDVRLVCATNRDLAREVAKGRFREDLYYRLNVVPLTTPPLRERIGDVTLLAGFFLRRFRAREGREKVLDPATLAALERYSWPGNVRELENVIQRLVVLSKNGTLRPEDLPPEICRHAEPAVPQPSAPQVGGDRLLDFEKAAIANALSKAGGNRRQAARILEIGEATLYRKLKKYGF